MAQLATAAPYIGLATTAIQAYSSIRQGRAAKANADAIALQQEREGKAAQAESQRIALNERKKANYAESRALAVASASGAGVSNPTVENILGKIQAEGDYRVLSSLYAGDTDAELANYAADTTRRQGRARQRGAYLNAGSTILSGANDFYSKYGDSSKHYSGSSSRYSNIGDFNIGGTGGLA